MKADPSQGGELKSSSVSSLTSSEGEDLQGPLTRKTSGTLVEDVVGGLKLWRQVWLSMPAVLLISLGKPQFPHVENGDNNAYLTGYCED